MSWFNFNLRDLEKLFKKPPSTTDLQSTEFVRVVDVISEGEIGGLVDGDKSIYLNETPVRSSTGVLNFQNVSYQERVGTQSQTYATGFSDVETETTVSTRIENGTPVIRSISNADINAVNIKLSVPSLLYQDQETGETRGNSVAFKIELQANGGGYTTIFDTKITGKTQSKYQRSYRVPLTGSAPWDIKVTRLSSDSVQLYDQRFLDFDSYTSIIEAKLTYPNTAYVALKVDASQFSSVPKRSYHVKLLKIKIPSNATVRTDGSLIYTGSWDGTFQATKQWCADPAWCLYDLVTSERFGLGTYISESLVDKWALYSISNYCSELIDDGNGGLEPRFSISVYFQEQQEAHRIIQDLCTIFRGMSFWSAGGLTFTQDAPADPVYLYTQANVIDGSFSYSGSSQKARHTVAVVAWNDPADLYKQKIEYVEDEAAIAQYGIIKLQVNPIGCTSRGQANRVGRWILYTEQNESEIVSFKTGIEAAIARPGNIIKIADANRSGARMGGRISAATSSTLTIDSDPTTSLAGYTLYVVLPSGVIEEKTVLSNSGRVLTISGTFSTTPNIQSIWGLSTSTIEAQTFRVLSVSEAKDGLFEISAIKYDENKFASVENEMILPPRVFSTLTIIPDAPINLEVTEGLFNTISGVRAKAILSWERASNVTSYIVKYQKDEDNSINLGEVFTNTIDVLDVSSGIYTFQVASVNSLGNVSPFSSITQTLYGKTAPPADVLNFSLIPNANVSLLTWTQSVDLDVLIGGYVRIRHTPNLTLQSWSNAIDVTAALPGNSTSANVPLLNGTYLIKFVDSSGNESVNASQIVTTVPENLVYNVVDLQQEDPTFSGAKTDVVFIADLNGITLDTGTLVDDMGLIDDLSSFDFSGDVALMGTYYFTNTVDLGAVYPSRLTANIRVSAFDIGQLIDAMTLDIDSWTTIDGDEISGTNAQLYMRTTLDDPSGSPTWSEWRPFLTGEYSARGFEFKLELSTDDPSRNLVVDQLSVTIDVPDRVEDQKGIVSGVGSYHVTFADPFWQVPTIGVTSTNMTTGDYFTITGKTVSGFDIIFKDSTNATISRTFDVLVKGFGKNIT